MHPAGPPNFYPNQPTVFPTNFPDEVFYWIADSDKIDTPVCPGVFPPLAGGAFMLVSGVSLTGANPTSFTFTNNCTASLGAGQTCTIDVRFAPKAAGALSASLRVTSNTAQNPQSVALSGTGTAPTVSLSSTSLSFGNVQLGRNSSKALTVQNKGTAPLNFTSFTISGTNAADVHHHAEHVRRCDDRGKRQVFHHGPVRPDGRWHADGEPRPGG